MKKIDGLLPILLVISIAAFTWNEKTSDGVFRDYWWSKWAAVLISSAVFAGARLGLRLRSFFAGGGLAWIIISGLFVFSWRENQYLAFNDDSKNVINAGAAYGTASFLVMFLAVASMNRRARILFEEAIKYLCVISSTLVCVHWARGRMSDFSTGGLFDQGSMEGLFIAFTYPFIMLRPHLSIRERMNFPYQKYVDLIFLALPLLAVTVLCTAAHASQPIVVMSGLVALSVISESRNLRHSIVDRKNTMIFFAAILITILGIGIYFNEDFFQNAGRFVVYKMNVRFLLDRPIVSIIGTGTGTYPSIGPALQKAFGLTDGHSGFFLWAHSDWLQIWFEHGLIGLFLGLGLFIECVTKAVKSGRQWLAISVCGYAAAMIFNYPLHLAVHSFVGMFLVVVCLED